MYIYTSHFLTCHYYYYIYFKYKLLLPGFTLYDIFYKLISLGWLPVYFYLLYMECNPQQIWIPQKFPTVPTKHGNTPQCSPSDSIESTENAYISWVLVHVQ